MVEGTFMVKMTTCRKNCILFVPGRLFYLSVVCDGVAGGVEDLVPGHHPGRDDEVLLSEVCGGPQPLLRAALDAGHVGRLHRTHDLLSYIMATL